LIKILGPNELDFLSFIYFEMIFKNKKPSLWEKVFFGVAKLMKADRNVSPMMNFLFFCESRRELGCF